MTIWDEIYRWWGQMKKFQGWNEIGGMKCIADLEEAITKKQSVLCQVVGSERQLLKQILKSETPCENQCPYKIQLRDLHSTTKKNGGKSSCSCSPCFGMVSVDMKLILCKPHTLFSHVPVTGHSCWLWHWATLHTAVVQTGVNFTQGSITSLCLRFLFCQVTAMFACFRTPISNSRCVFWRRLETGLIMSLLQVSSCSALVMSCSLVLFNTEQLQYFLWRESTLSEERCYIRNHMHCAPKFQSCSAAWFPGIMWVLSKYFNVLREALPVLCPLFYVIRSVILGTSSRWC